MTIRFFLSNPKADKCSIDAIVNRDGVRYKKSAGVSIETKYWNSDKQSVIVPQKYRDGIIVNHKLNELRLAAERAHYNIELSGIVVEDPKHFWKIVECEVHGRPYPRRNSDIRHLSEYFRDVFIPRFRLSKSYDRIKRFHVVLSKLESMERAVGRKYSFEQVDQSFYRDLQNYMYGLKHSANYFGSVVKIIKQVMREARIIDKIHDNDMFTHSAFKSITQETDHIYLTVEELNAVYAAPLDQTFIDRFYPRSAPGAAPGILRSYTIVRNRFLIGAFTGLRMSDFNRIDRQSISRGFITVVADKTDQRVVIPIHPIVQSIIDSGFDLSLSLSDAKTRLYIKDICRHAGLDEIIEVRRSESGRTIVHRKHKWMLVRRQPSERLTAPHGGKSYGARGARLRRGCGFSFLGIAIYGVSFKHLSMTLRIRNSRVKRSNLTAFLFLLKIVARKLAE